MPMPSLSVASRGLIALPAVASLFLTAGAAHAAASDDTYTVKLRQELPRTATSTSGGVPQKDNNQCPGISATQDGWHFVLPGNASHFVKLTVTFEPGGQQVVTDFGPPSDKHAYVASAPGAELTSAVAEVTGGELDLFNLSHTCPASASVPTQQPAEQPTGEPTGQPCEDASTNTPGTSCELCDEASSETSGEPCQETSSTPSDETSATPSSAASPNGSGDGDLAATGAGPTIGLAAAAALLLTAGGYLVMRRRKTAAHQD